MSPPASQPHEIVATYAPTLTQLDRKLAIGFGALVLLLMIVVSLVGSRIYQRVAKTNEDVLTTVLTGILSDSVNRTSFSGRYHMRLLLEQIVEKNPQLTHVYVANPDGEIIAHSDPEKNASTVPDYLISDLRNILTDAATVIKDRVDDGIPVKEIIMPYRAGYEDNIAGVIVAGVSLRDLSAPIMGTWIIMLSLILFLTALSLLATYLMSKRFAGPVKQLAWILNGILEHSPVYIGIFRPDGSLEESSANYRTLLPHTPLHKGPLQSAIHATEKTAHVSESVYLRDNVERIAVATTFPISRNRDGSPSLLCSIAADVTEQRRAEAALREHRDLLEATVQQRTQDLEDANAALSLRENRACILGRLKETLLGDDAFDMKVARIARCGVQLIGANRCQIWVLGPPDKCENGCCRAIDKNAATRCNDQHSCLHLAVNIARDGDAEEDTHDRIPLGYSLVGKLASSPGLKLIQHDLSQGEIPKDGWITELGLTSFAGFRLTSRKGELAGVLTVFGRKPFEPEDESVLEELGTTASYVIQAKLAADELEALNNNLIQSERLATLGELTATVSHELRNPLGTIQASHFLLKGRLRDTTDEKIAGALDRAERGIHRCDRIIEALLDFTRETTLHTEATRLDTWLPDEISAYDFPDGIEVRTSITAPDPVQIDRQIFYQCLTNLLNNACDALLDTTDSARTEPPRITITLEVSAEELHLTIGDNGTGISRENLASVFKPLFSTKGFGTGLGLPLVRKLLDIHGGRIELTSQWGEGTQVQVVLPLKRVISDESARLNA